MNTSTINRKTKDVKALTSPEALLLDKLSHESEERFRHAEDLKDLSAGFKFKDELGIGGLLALPSKLEELRDDPNVKGVTTDDDPTIELVTGLINMFLPYLLALAFKKKSKTVK